MGCVSQLVLCMYVPKRNPAQALSSRNVERSKSAEKQNQPRCVSIHTPNFRDLIESLLCPCSSVRSALESPPGSIETAGGGSGSASGQTSLLAALAAEREAAAELEAAEMAAAERVAREFRGFFHNMPRVRIGGRKASLITASLCTLQENGVTLPRVLNCSGCPREQQEYRQGRLGVGKRLRPIVAVT